MFADFQLLSRCSPVAATVCQGPLVGRYGPYWCFDVVFCAPLLFGRIVIACVKARAVRDALRVHHSPRSSPSILEKARALFARVPVQVHTLVVGLTVSAAPWLVPASLQVEGSPVGNALWVAVKWSALGLSGPDRSEKDDWLNPSGTLLSSSHYICGLVPPRVPRRKRKDSNSQR